MEQFVTLVSDILLGAGAFGAAVYCWVLSQRLKRFNNLENGVGGAVALLSAQVDDMTKTLDLARKAASHSSETLTALTERAETASRKLELMLAALNDLPDAPPAQVGPVSSAEPPEKPSPAPEPVSMPEVEAEAAQDAAWVAAAAEAPGAGEETPFFLSRRARIGGVSG